MTLFWAAIERYSVSLFKFPFLSHVQDFSCEIMLVCRLKYPYSCFVDLSVLSAYSDCWNKFLLLFFMQSSSRRLDPSTLSWMLANPLPLFFFLDTYRLCHLSVVKPYASSLTFLFSGPLVKVLPTSTPRMVSSIVPAEKRFFSSLFLL